MTKAAHRRKRLFGFKFPEGEESSMAASVRHAGQGRSSHLEPQAQNRKSTLGADQDLKFLKPNPRDTLPPCWWKCEPLQTAPSTGDGAFQLTSLWRTSHSNYHRSHDGSELLVPLILLHRGQDDTHAQPRHEALAGSL